MMAERYFGDEHISQPISFQDEEIRGIQQFADPAPEVYRSMHRTIRLVFVPDPDFEVIIRKIVTRVDGKVFVETWERRKVRCGRSYRSIVRTATGRSRSG